MESVFIGVGILSVLTVVTMRQDSAGAGAAKSAVLVTVGDALVTLQEWTFNLGPGFVVGVGNGLLLGYMMYKTGLVPRGMAMLGLVGGPLICLSGRPSSSDSSRPAPPRRPSPACRSSSGSSASAST